MATDDRPRAGGPLSRDRWIAGAIGALIGSGGAWLFGDFGLLSFWCGFLGAAAANDFRRAVLRGDW